MHSKRQRSLSNSSPGTERSVRRIVWRSFYLAERNPLRMRILIIEDEVKTANFLKKGFGESGFVVDIAKDGLDGLHLGLEIDFDIIILDLMLPHIDGWQVLARLREANRQAPVLVLTALDAVHERVRGFELGADDYLVKPFAFSELLARVRSLLRRASPASKKQYVWPILKSILCVNALPGPDSGSI